MSGDEDNSKGHDDGPRSFWVTAPGLITAIGGLLTAVAVLIGSLSAAGVIGGNGRSSSPSTAASSGAAEGSLNDAVLHGDWLVDLTVRRVDGLAAIGNNTLWKLEPTRGASRQEHWTLESTCLASPCETRWDSVETPDRFATVMALFGVYRLVAEPLIEPPLAEKRVAVTLTRPTMIYLRKSRNSLPNLY